MPITRQIIALFPDPSHAQLAAERLELADVEDDRLDVTVLDEPRPVTELVLRDTRARRAGSIGALSGAVAGVTGPLVLWALGALALTNLGTWVAFSAVIGALFGALSASLMGLSFPSARASRRREKLRGEHAVIEVVAREGLLSSEVARLTRLLRHAGAERISTGGLPA